MKKYFAQFLHRTCEFSHDTLPILPLIIVMAGAVGFMRGVMLGRWDEHPSLMLIIWRVGYTSLILIIIGNLLFVVSSELYYWGGRLRQWAKVTKYKYELDDEKT